jgi:hypothetical protein
MPWWICDLKICDGEAERYARLKMEEANTNKKPAVVVGARLLLAPFQRNGHDVIPG